MKNRNANRPLLRRSATRHLERKVTAFHDPASEFNRRFAKYATGGANQERQIDR